MGVNLPLSADRVDRPEDTTMTIRHHFRMRRC